MHILGLTPNGRYSYTATRGGRVRYEKNCAQVSTVRDLRQAQWNGEKTIHTS